MTAILPSVETSECLAENCGNSCILAIGQINNICNETERREATTDVATIIVDVLLREEVD